MPCTGQEKTNGNAFESQLILPVPSMAVAFSQQNVAPIISDLDYVVQMFRMKDAAPSKSVGCAVHRGPIWVSLFAISSTRKAYGCA